MKTFVARLLNATSLALAGLYVALAAIFVAVWNTAAQIGLPLAPLQLAVTDTSAVSNTIQAYYDKRLLDRAVQATRLQDFAQLKSIPPGIGSTSIRFYRPPVASLTATGAPAAITEGVNPTNYRDLSYTAIDVTLAQRGEVGKITDITSVAQLVDHLNTAVDLYGDDFALDCDTQIRNVLCHASTGLAKRYAQGLANFAAVAGATAANSCLIPRDFLDAQTALMIARAPTINGYYAAIVPPQGQRDILNNSEFRELIRQGYAERMFKGEIAEWTGIKFVVGTNPQLEDETEGTHETGAFSGAGTNTTGFIYTTVVTGKGGYGTVDIKKLGGVAKKPTMVMVNTPDSGNPLGLFTMVGWKAFWAAKTLKSDWGVALRHKTQYVA